MICTSIRLEKSNALGNDCVSACVYLFAIWCINFPLANLTIIRDSSLILLKICLLSTMFCATQDKEKAR